MDYIVTATTEGLHVPFLDEHRSALDARPGVSVLHSQAAPNEVTLVLQAENPQDARAMAEAAIASLPPNVPVLGIVSVQPG